MKLNLKTFKSLCTPAQLYLVMSGLSFLAILMQNCSDSSSYKIGTMQVKPQCHNAVFFIFKALYILAFTFLLNWFCSKKLTTLSWILVLLPFIGMFLILGALSVATFEFIFRNIRNNIVNFNEQQYLYCFYKRENN